MGARQLRKIQMGAEGTAGTSTSATMVWRGVGTLQDDTVISPTVEDVGVLGGIDRIYEPQIESSLAMGATECTFEQLPYLLEGAIKKVGTGAADGSGSDKIYTYPVSSTTQATIQTYTIEGGDNTGAEKMSYGYVTDFQIDGQIYKSLTMTATWKARGTAPATFTAGKVPPTVDVPIMTGTAKLYIDPNSGTIGSTQISGSLRQLSIKVKSGLEPVPSVENLYYTTVALVDPQITGSMVLYWDANAIAEKAAWLAQTLRQVQIVFQGPAVQTAGSVYTYKTLKIQMYGFYWTKFSSLGDVGGHNIVTSTFENRYDITKSNYCNFIVVNELANLP
jgi:hypothetical protein